jgi:uncharacterized protein (TIGR02678 family)
MTSQLASTLNAAQRAERTAALRHLLHHPLTVGDENPEVFGAIVRHREWLGRWFGEQPGWKLIVEPAAGFARLHKVPARQDASRPARPNGKSPFDTRRYFLLCLTLAALDDSPMQTTLARLAELVVELSSDTPEVAQFDPNTFAERRAFVDVLRWLVDNGVLGIRDGDAERYARDRQGDALYDVNDRLLSQLVSAPISPALAANPGDLLRELYPETEEGQRSRLRHSVIRRLLDDPVLYYEDLEQPEYDWLNHSRGFVHRLMEEEVGFRIERRKEGMATVDTEGTVTDTKFPDGGSTVKHAALLLAEQLTRLCKGHEERCFTHTGAVALISDLLADYGDRCHWSQQYVGEDEGAERLAEDALALLESFGLVARTANGWKPRPAIARFVPAAPRASVQGGLW